MTLSHQLERETAVFFDMSHLRWLAATARWDDLTSYVDPFLPSPMSVKATAFLHCVHIYSVLGMIAAGGKHADGIDRLHSLLDAAAASAKADPHTANLHTFFHKVREHPPRDVRSWMKIWEAAAERLKSLASSAPSSKASCICKCPNTPQSVGKLTFGGVRSVPRPWKEKGNTLKACDISCFYEQKRQEINKKLSGFSSNGTSYSVISDMQVGPSVLEVAATEGDKSKFKKRKRSATLETDKDASTKLKLEKNLFCSCRSDPVGYLIWLALLTLRWCFV